MDPYIPQIFTGSQLELCRHCPSSHLGKLTILNPITLPPKPPVALHSLIFHGPLSAQCPSSWAVTSYPDPVPSSPQPLSDPRTYGDLPLLMDWRILWQHSSNPKPVKLWPLLKPRKKSGQPGPTSLTSNKFSAFTVPLPIPALQSEHPPHAGLWARVGTNVALSSLLGGQYGKKDTTILIILEMATLKHRDVQAPTQGYTAHKRPWLVLASL